MGSPTFPPTIPSRCSRALWSSILRKFTSTGGAFVFVEEYLRPVRKLGWSRDTGNASGPARVGPLFRCRGQLRILAQVVPEQVGNDVARDVVARWTKAAGDENDFGPRE